MAPSLTPSQVATIKATVPVLAQHGLTITKKFYADMLTANPQLKNYFNHTHQATGHQAAALANALHAYASNIDALGNLSPALELICHKHASLYIKPEQYAVVGKHLLDTIASVLGDAATPDILDAWGAAYQQLADIMIAKEADLLASAPGWRDWRDFRIVRKEKETDEITSFYLEPVESGFEIPAFKPGQYVSVNIFVDELDGGCWQARQYSLSDAPGKRYLRISVKKEPGVVIGEKKSMSHPGYLSNILHEKRDVGDVVRVSHPFGDFYFDEDAVGKDTPVVLISAGVGLTCLSSILNTLVEKKTSRPISWIHVAKNSSTRAFKKQTDQLAVNNENFKTVYFSSRPKEGEVQGRDFHFQGRLDLDRVDKKDLFTENDKTLYFVCGPPQFMVATMKKLVEYGVPEERIKMELFGTGGVPKV